MSSLNDADKFSKDEGLNGAAIHVAGRPPKGYGISLIPHKVLIDSDGTVVKNFEMELPYDIDDLLSDLKKES